MSTLRMEPQLFTDQRLQPVLAALTECEPLFHRRDLVASRADFERETAKDFWEVGASGQRYSREYVWSVLRERFESSATDEELHPHGLAAL
jgi:hypothetical protein